MMILFAPAIVITKSVLCSSNLFEIKTNSVYTFKHVSENRFQDSRTFIEITGSTLVASTLKREGISIIFFFL